MFIHWLDLKRLNVANLEICAEVVEVEVVEDLEVVATRDDVSSELLPLRRKQ